MSSGESPGTADASEDTRSIGRKVVVSSALMVASRVAIRSEIVTT